jgi:hypothetical protein
MQNMASIYTVRGKHGIRIKNPLVVRFAQKHYQRRTDDSSTSQCKKHDTPISLVDRWPEKVIYFLRKTKAKLLLFWRFLFSLIGYHLFHSQFAVKDFPGNKEIRK